MIKWPEPVELNPAANSVMGHSDATLKQAVRDALNLAADTCDSTLYVNGDGAVSVFGPKTEANVEIRKCRDAIRALAQPPALDCRTCEHFGMLYNKPDCCSLEPCTNGDKYIEAPSVVLWRTE